MYVKTCAEYVTNVNKSSKRKKFLRIKEQCNAKSRTFAAELKI